MFDVGSYLNKGLKFVTGVTIEICVKRLLLVSPN